MIFKRKRPKWNSKSVFLYSAAITFIVVISMLLIPSKDIWKKLDYCSFAMSFIAFCFLWYIYYFGIIFDKNGQFEFAWSKLKIELDPQFSGASEFFDLESGFLGIILMIIIEFIFLIILSILFSFLFWLFSNLLLLTLFILTFPIVYLFNRVLRYIVWKGRRGFNNAKNSFKYAFVISIMFFGMVFILLNLIKYLFVDNQIKLILN